MPTTRGIAQCFRPRKVTSLLTEDESITHASAIAHLPCTNSGFSYALHNHVEQNAHDFLAPPSLFYVEPHCISSRYFESLILNTTPACNRQAMLPFLDSKPMENNAGIYASHISHTMDCKDGYWQMPFSNERYSLSLSCIQPYPDVVTNHLGIDGCLRSRFRSGGRSSCTDADCEVEDSTEDLSYEFYDLFDNIDWPFDVDLNVEYVFVFVAEDNVDPDTEVVFRLRGGGKDDDDRMKMPTWDGERGVSFERFRRNVKAWTAGKYCHGNDDYSVWQAFTGTDQGGDDIANGAVAMPAGAALGPAQRFRNRRQSESWSLACQMVPEESDIRQLLLALALGDVVVAGVAVGHFRGIGRI